MAPAGSATASARTAGPASATDTRLKDRGSALAHRYHSARVHHGGDRVPDPDSRRPAAARSQRHDRPHPPFRRKASDLPLRLPPQYCDFT